MEQKYIGELPENVGVTSVKGKQMAADLAGLARGRAGMLFEHGAKVSGIDANAQGHKIFFDLASLCSSDFAIAYSGQDGTTTLGDQGTYGARQVLYGVSYDLLRWLAKAMCGGLNEVLARWAFYNFGRADYPQATIKIPDLETEQARKTEAERRPIMIRELQALASKGPVEASVVHEVAGKYGVVVSNEWAALWMREPPPPVPGFRRVA
jgi:hypothetical protein